MRPTPRRERGQILVLFAGGLLAFIGLVALALDLSMVYSLQRTERSAADSAALAGAQDLQQPGSRTVTSAQRIRARCHALANLAGTFAVAAPTCPTTDDDIVDYPLTGTPYRVSIKTPSPSYVNVAPARAVQVTVRHPDVSLTFARLFGQRNWNVAVTSVAGLDFGKSYAIVTLRPPKKLGSTFDVKDIKLDGGTIVNVQHGDVGTNANMDYSGVASGTIMNIDHGYGMYYFDPYSAPLWYPTAPKPPAQTVTNITSPIADPNYNNFATVDGYPSMAGAPTFADYKSSDARSDASVPGSFCAQELASIDKTAYAFLTPTYDKTKIFCYNPGIYTDQIIVKMDEVAILSSGPSGVSGLYYLKGGLNVSGNPAFVIGGYKPGVPGGALTGVALMFDEAGPGKCAGCIFNATTAKVIALNAGTKFPPTSTGGVAATAARDWAGTLVQTSGPSSPTPPLVLTLLVKKDPTCFVPTSAPFIEPSGCDANSNKTLNMAGGGSLALEGVQYAPTDNIEIHGGSSGYGQVGQIISWTLFYSGGTHINQEGPSSEGQGIIHLDAACSGGTTPCTP